MRRRYDSALVRDVAAEIRRRMPDASLGTDLIAGFPGESDADFARGAAILEELPFTYFHVFPYSKRSGTTAAKATDTVPPATIESRAAALRVASATARAVGSSATAATTCASASPAATSG
jgi:threonylcarbamoyladenosine tRNA methylthiotransferase MtaB